MLHEVGNNNDAAKLCGVINKYLINVFFMVSTYMMSHKVIVIWGNRHLWWTGHAEFTLPFV